MNKESSVKLLKLKETDIQRQILQFLKYRNDVVLYGRINTAGTYDPIRHCRRKNPYLLRGFPDIFGFIKPKHEETYLYTPFYIECKTQGNKLSEAQMIFRKYAEESGAIYIVAYGLKEVESML